MIYNVIIIDFSFVIISYSFFLLTPYVYVHIKNFFKVKSADEIEVRELLLTQFSRASRAKTLETAITISTISTKIISIMDLSNDVNNIESLVNYYDSDDSVADVDLNGTNQPSFPDLDSDIGVEFVKKIITLSL